MQPGDIISYREMCNQEQVETLQRGMNYRLHPTHSVFLMSTSANAPYDDEVQNDGQILIYEGHDVRRSNDIPDPKQYDQPMYYDGGPLTQNGLFYQAAQEYKANQRPAEIICVYEKIKGGIWVFNGRFELLDAWLEESNGRKVFKYKLVAVDSDIESKRENATDNTLEHTRMIPSSVKLQVWKRDKGRCVNCGNEKNLHYDHIIPYSRGGTSLSAKNIQLLCMKCNLSKSDKIQ